MKKLIVIGGATASGKTATALHLARHFNCPILSADSRQFYREMSIGTAKPTNEELKAATHFFINSLSIHDAYSVGAFERDALEILNEVFQQHDFALLVGGSGLFIRAVCEGLDTFPEISISSKTWVAEGEASCGLSWLQEQVALLDPRYYARVDTQNPARLRRALEVCRESGQPYSSFLQSDNRHKREFQPVYILLDWPRQTLYERIDQRVDQMVGAGLESEAKALLPYRTLSALRTVGYEEFFDYFDGKTDLETCVKKIKQHSRNYAKRQSTWFKKHGRWTAFAASQLDQMTRFIESAETL